MPERDRLIDVLVGVWQGVDEPHTRDDLGRGIDALFTDANFNDVIRVLGGIKLGQDALTPAPHKTPVAMDVWAFLPREK